MDIFDQDQAYARILENECPRFWESVRVLLIEIASKAESPVRRVTMNDDSVYGCVIIQTEEGRCPDLFHPKSRTLTVRFNNTAQARTITAEVTNSCPGVPERKPDRYIFQPHLETGTAIAVLRENRFTKPNEVANDILAKFFRIRPLAPVGPAPD
jgi:hypothetical protein